MSAEFKTLHTEALFGDRDAAELFYAELTPEWLDNYDNSFKFDPTRAAARMAKFIMCREIVVVSPYWELVSAPIHIHLAQHRSDLHEAMDEQLRLAVVEGIPIIRSKTEGVHAMTDAGHIRILPDKTPKVVEVFGNSLHYGQANPDSENGRLRSVQQMQRIVAGSDWLVRAAEHDIS